MKPILLVLSFFAMAVSARAEVVISGEFNQPSTFEISETPNLKAAILKAGGIGPFCAYIYIRREEDGKIRVLEIPIAKFKIDAPEGIEIEDNDWIHGLSRYSWGEPKLPPEWWTEYQNSPEKFELSDSLNYIFKTYTPHMAQQAGTGQPATRPESKSESGDKPQPEADGRSR
jgi:hypothetical protein